MMELNKMLKKFEIYMVTFQRFQKKHLHKEENFFLSEVCSGVEYKDKGLEEQKNSHLESFQEPGRSINDLDTTVT